MSFALLSTTAFCLAMLVPSAYAFVAGDALSGRTFLYGAILGVGLCAAIGVATLNQNPAENRRALLLTLLFVFGGLPLGLAIPVVEILRTTTLFHAYLDMVSAITTTALPIYDLDRLPDAVILWRSIVAWMGGFYIWTAALVIFLPLRLGGFETLSNDHRYIGPNDARRAKENTLSHRFVRETRAIFPVYSSL
ncbi:MAG: TrkH family potassium uptake protein, partial [Planktomarina sp.]